MYYIDMEKETLETLTTSSFKGLTTASEQSKEVYISLLPMVHKIHYCHPSLLMVNASPDIGTCRGDMDSRAGLLARLLSCLRSC